VYSLPRWPSPFGVLKRSDEDAYRIGVPLQLHFSRQCLLVASVQTFADADSCDLGVGAEYTVGVQLAPLAKPIRRLEAL